MSADPSARARFADLVARDPVPLDEAALAIAQEEYPRLDPAAYLARLDALGERVRRRAPMGRAASVLHALREVLADEERLRGDDATPQDARNAFLNDVLDRKLGSPTSLSVVWAEVARRAGLQLDGVGFPGHFLARYGSPSGAEVFVDAFHGGEVLSRSECLARYRGRAAAADLDRRWLEPLGPRQILARMLNDLRRIYASTRDDVRAWWVLDRILVLVPGQLEALRERGLASARLGGTGAAVRDLEAYLARAGTAPDAPDVRKALASVRTRRALPN